MGIIPAFRDVVVGNGFNLEDLSPDQIAELWAEYDQIIWNRVQDMRTAPELSASIGSLNHFLAEEVIATHLGARWVENNIINLMEGARPAKENEHSRNYLAPGNHALRKALALHRIHELARRLYQLQSFEWFDPVLDGVRTRDLSGAAFELDVLWALQIASPHVATRCESGVKGNDYDAFALMGEHLVPVEAKAKDDSTPWSAKTVINTVKGAARQLPSGNVGLLFLRIPTSWIGRSLEEGYSGALAEGTRQTSRIGAVITAIDKPHLTSAATGNVSRHFHYFAAEDCPEYIWSFCMRFRQFWEAGTTLMAPAPPF